MQNQWEFQRERKESGMNKRSVRKKAAAGTALFLAAAMPVTTAWAGEEAVRAQKEQTVYVNADENGTPEKVIVSSWLKNTEGASTLQDYSSLSGIENVKGNEEYTVGEDGSILWNAQGSDIYYRGEGSTELPVEVKMTYYLDGQEMNPQDLAGKSGQVKIRIDYVNHSRQQVEVEGEQIDTVTPFLMVTGMILPNENFSNVQVKNGKVISDGQKSLVIGLGLPGPAEELSMENVENLKDVEIPDYVEVTANAKDFSLDMTATLVSTGTLSQLGLDNGGNLQELKEKLDQLTDGSTQLVQGSGELEDGTLALEAGARQLAEGLAGADGGAQALKEGLDQLDSRKQDLLDGVDRLVQGLDGMDAGVGELKTGIFSYTDGVEKLAQGTAQVDAGAGQIEDGLKLICGDSPEGGQSIRDLQEGAASLEQGVAAYTEGVASLNEGLSLLQAQLQDQLGQASELPESARQLIQGCDSLEKALGQISQGVGQVKQASAGMKAQMETLNQGIGKAGELIRTAAQVISENMTNNVEAANKAAKGQAQQQANAQAKNQGESQANQQMNQKVSAALAAAGVTGEQAEQVMKNLGTIGLDIRTDINIDVSGNMAAGTETLEGIANQLLGIADQMKQIDISGITSLEAGANQALAAVEQLETGTKQLAQAGEGLENFPQLAKQIQDAVDQLTSGAGQLTAQNQQLTDGVKALKGGLQTTTEALKKLEAGAGTLKEGTASLQAGAHQVIRYNVSLNQGIGQLQLGSKELSEGGKTLQAGAQVLSDGVGQLAQGAGTLKEGTAQLKNGGSQMVSGTDELASGASALKKGMEELDREGIQKISQVLNGDLQDILRKLDAAVEADGQYHAFDGKNDGEEDSVKFIIETAGIQ